MPTERILSESPEAIPFFLSRVSFSLLIIASDCAAGRRMAIDSVDDSLFQRSVGSGRSRARGGCNQAAAARISIGIKGK